MAGSPSWRPVENRYVLDNLADHANATRPITICGVRSSFIGLTFRDGISLRSVLGSRGFEYGKDYNLIHVRPAFATLTNGLIAATILPVPINYAAMEMGLNAAHQYSYRELLSKKRLE